MSYCEKCKRTDSFDEWYACTLCCELRPKGEAEELRKELSKAHLKIEELQTYLQQRCPHNVTLDSTPPYCAICGKEL